MEHIRKGQMPVKELVLFRQTFDLISHPKSEAVGILLNLTEYFFCNGRTKLFCLFPDERGAPSVSPELAKLIRSRCDELVIVLLLAMDIFNRIVAYCIQLHYACRQLAPTVP